MERRIIEDTADGQVIAYRKTPDEVDATVELRRATKEQEDLVTRILLDDVVSRRRLFARHSSADPRPA